MNLTDYLLIGLCVLVVAVGVLLYYHHMAVMDNLAFIRKSIGFQPQQRYEPPPMSMRQMEIPMRPMEMPIRQMGMPMNLQVEVPPNSPKKDDSSSTESELQRQIEQYKRELEGVEDDLVFSHEENESTNDSDGSSVLNIEEEIDTLDLENAESELEERVSQTNELKESEVKTQEEKIMEHLNDLEDPSSQKDELMEKILNNPIKIESVVGEEESILTNNENSEELKIITKKYSLDELRDLCKKFTLLNKGNKKDLALRLLGCGEFREEIMLKGEL